MSTIFHIMKEEYDRLSEAEHVYQNNIKQMPKGSLQIKHIRHGDYIYLVRRDGDHVLYNYIGRKDSPKAAKLIKEIDKRKRLGLLLKETRLTLKDVKKVLRGKI